MAKPLSINVLETLVNLLDMYESKYEEILVLEAIANGMDANADEIEINFDEDDFGYYVIFSNNGPPMNEKDFDNYHNISSSTKTKGEGIGFAGVGAKIFLGAWDKAEITTITGKNNKVFVSRMFRENNKVLHESSLDGVPIKQILRNRKLNHSYGTSYKVKIDAEGFKWLKNRLLEICG